MDYSWQIVMENYTSPGPRSVTFAATEPEEMSSPRPTTARSAALAVRPSSAMDYRYVYSSAPLTSNIVTYFMMCQCRSA